MASKQPEGIVFPANETGERSTTDAAKKIFAAVFEAVGEKQLAEQVIAEKNWRYKYNRFVIKHVESSLKSPENAIKAAKAGLDYMHNNFEFVRDGKTMKFADAMKQIKGTFHTGEVKGTGAKPDQFELVVPYKGKQLKGESLLAQLNKWAKYGTIEPDAAEAISQVVKNKQWVDLSDKYFVLLGAGSAMGPFLVLMALGANVIAVDLDRPGIWKRLITVAKGSPGKLIFPLKKPQSEITNDDDLFAQAGSNLITQAPEIYNWVSSLVPDKPITVGCYVYLDGEAHVRVALACDGIMKGLTENRKNVSLAFLCTPTDVHVIPDDARRAALSNYTTMDWKNLSVLPVRMFGGNKYLVKNALPPVKASDNNEFSYVDGLVVAQGPNYALAKRMQHWRAVVARSSGNPVSSHIAPSTATASVVHNKQFAWAYDGLPFFRPFEVFEQETSNSVMTALLVHDLRNPNAVANPSVTLRNPLEMFKYYGCHGGVWRSGYKMGTVGEVSVLVHFIKVGRPILFLLLAALIFVVARSFRQ